MMMYSCLMHDIGPSWSEDTISYLIGKSQSSDTFRVEFLESSTTTSDTNNNTKTGRSKIGGLICRLPPNGKKISPLTAKIILPRQKKNCCGKKKLPQAR